MAHTSEGLVLHLAFNELTEGHVPDVSGNNRHGVLKGSPVLVNDPFFGAALTLNGTDQWIAVSNDPGLQIAGDLTLGMWLKPSALDQRRNPINKAYGGEGTITLEPTGRLSYFYGQAGRDAHPYQQSTTTDVIVVDEWAHVAVVRDFQAKTVTWYINGEEVGQDETTFESAKVSPSDLLIGKGYLHPYAGAIAHVRLYDRALTRDEILLDIDDDRTALAAFQSTHPVSFSLSDQDEQNVLSIRTASSKGSYHLDVQNDTRRRIAFRKNGLASTRATSESSFFELVFRPGTLNESTLDGLAVAEDGWSLGYSKRGNGAVALFFRSDGDVTLGPGDVHTLTIQNVEIAPAGGSRGTRVEFRYRDLHVGNGRSVSGTRLQHMSIVNERGRKTIPLRTGFIGPSAVVNNGTTKSALTVRLTNTMTLDPGHPDRSTIRFNPADHKAPSKLVLSFDTQAQGEEKPWAIATNDQARGFHVTYGGDTIRVEGEQGRAPEWVIPLGITELAAGEHVDVEVENILTSLQAGPTAVYVRYENVPGYRDGTFEAVAQKSPLLFINSKVGLGSNDPSSPLTIRAAGKGDALVSFENSGGTTKWHINLGDPEAKRGLNVAETKVADARLFLQEGGNVGIGTGTPEGKLQIIDKPQTANGRTLMLGSVKESNLRLGYHADYSWIQSHMQRPLAINPIGNNVGIGTATPGAKLEVKGNVKASSLEVAGTIKAKSLEIEGEIKANNFPPDRMVSKNGKYFLIMQNERNIVAYQKGGHAFWHSDTSVNSDIRLKTDIAALESPLEKIMQLRGVSFRWKDEELAKRREIGVIAQEVEKLFPDLVQTIEDRKFVSYQGLIPVLVEAIKEQQALIEQLQEKH